MKKRFLSVLLVFMLVFGMIPIMSMTAYAASVNVTNKKDFTTALNGSADEIQIVGDFTYYGTLDTQKTITVKSGYKLQIGNGNLTINAPLKIENGGTLQIHSSTGFNYPITVNVA